MYTLYNIYQVKTDKLLSDFEMVKKYIDNILVLKNEKLRNI